MKKCPNPFGIEEKPGQIIHWPSLVCFYPGWRVCCPCGIMGPLKDTEKEAQKAWDHRTAEA